MPDNDSIKNVEKSFYHDGYKLGISACENEFSDENLFEAIKKMYEAIDQLIGSLIPFAQKQGLPIECRKGCEWCCHQPVFAAHYELQYLRYYLENYLLGEIKAIRLKATKKQKVLNRLSGDALLNSKFPCPLLDDKICIAYLARPMACRIYLSTNKNSCIDFYNHPDDKSNFPALLDLPMRLGRMMNEGFKAALKTHGITSKEYRIDEMFEVGSGVRDLQ